MASITHNIGIYNQDAIDVQPSFKRTPPPNELFIKNQNSQMSSFCTIQPTNSSDFKSISDQSLPRISEDAQTQQPSQMADGHKNDDERFISTIYSQSLSQQHQPITPPQSNGTKLETTQNSNNLISKDSQKINEFQSPQIGVLQFQSRSQFIGSKQNRIQNSQQNKDDIETNSCQQLLMKIQRLLLFKEYLNSLNINCQLLTELDKRQKTECLIKQVLVRAAINQRKQAQTQLRFNNQPIAMNQLNYYPQSQSISTNTNYSNSQLGLQIANLIYNQNKLKQSASVSPLQMQIHYSQAQIMSILGEIPNPDHIVFQGRPRGKYRKNGSPFTSSQFRGVSKNGKKYQMFIMIDGKKKMYLGGYYCQQKAARAYDTAAIQLRGIKVILIDYPQHKLQAKTNFSYTKKEVLKIFEEEPVFKIYRPNNHPLYHYWRNLQAMSSLV